MTIEIEVATRLVQPNRATLEFIRRQHVSYVAIVPSSSPRYSVEITPEDARTLAAALLDFANDRPMVNPDVDRHSAFKEDTP